ATGLAAKRHPQPIFKHRFPIRSRTSRGLKITKACGSDPERKFLMASMPMVRGLDMRIGLSIATLLFFCLGAIPANAASQCDNPNALGLARTVEIDTTGGPGFGFEQYKMHDFLLQKEVVLTFDDGPWPENTRAVLEALAQHCTKATFFPIGKHALWHPE